MRWRRWILCGLVVLAAASVRAFEPPQTAVVFPADSNFPYATEVWVEEREVMDPRFDFKPRTTGPGNGDQPARPFKCGTCGLYSSIEYPNWDGKETITAYAARIGLPPALSVDLGSGVFLDMTLVPAGSGAVGTPEPRRPDEEWRGALIALSAAGLFLVLLLLSAFDVLIKRTRFQFSLRRLMLLGFAASTALVGGMWWSDLRQAWENYEVQCALYAARARSTLEVPRPFYMSRSEVTRAQVRAVLGPASQPDGSGTQPATNLTWAQSLEFCGSLTDLRQTGLTLSIPPHYLFDGFRLPTAAEWEYACRAGAENVYGLGDGAEALDRAGWWMGNSGGMLHPVGQKAPNAFGLFDMHGNAAEWCAADDSATEQYMTAFYQGILVSASDAPQVVCGGSYKSVRASCASAHRAYRLASDTEYEDVGVRVVLEAPATKSDLFGFRSWLLKNAKAD